MDLWSSYLLPLHLHKVCQGSKARQLLQGPFHLLLPLLQLPRPMLQACVEIVTPTSCRASRHHPPSRFPPALLGPTTLVPTQALLCILHQPVALRSRFATESTSIPVPGKQQLNWLRPGKTAVGCNNSPPGQTAVQAVLSFVMNNCREETHTLVQSCSSENDLMERAISCHML